MYIETYVYTHSYEVIIESNEIVNLTEGCKVLYNCSFLYLFPKIIQSQRCYMGPLPKGWNSKCTVFAAKTQLLGKELWKIFPTFPGPDSSPEPLGLYLYSIL